MSNPQQGHLTVGDQISDELVIGASCVDNEPPRSNPLGGFCVRSARMTLGERIFEMSEQGMSPKQIADKLDLDRDDVNGYIYRARQRMKRKAEVPA